MIKHYFANTFTTLSMMVPTVIGLSFERNKNYTVSSYSSRVI